MAWFCVGCGPLAFTDPPAAGPREILFGAGSLG
jgi:hypothetical protein